MHHDVSIVKIKQTCAKLDYYFKNGGCIIGGAALVLHGVDDTYADVDIAIPEKCWQYQPGEEEAYPCARYVAAPNDYGVDFYREEVSPAYIKTIHGLPVAGLEWLRRTYVTPRSPEDEAKHNRLNHFIEAGMPGLPVSVMQSHEMFKTFYPDHLSSFPFTFAMVKSHAAEPYASKIFDHVLTHDLSILGRQKVRLTTTMAKHLYREHYMGDYFPGLIESVTKSPVEIALIVGQHSVTKWREMLGATNPAEAAPGTIRRLFGEGLPDNAAHGSADDSAALREALLFYSPDFILSSVWAYNPY